MSTITVDTLEFTRKLRDAVPNAQTRAAMEEARAMVQARSARCSFSTPWR